jgi:ectoine hydroxylase-related dioxygenase (phytanoyl-CoA dioxygenase family)
MVAQILKDGRQYGSVILRILAGSFVFMFRGVTPAYAYQSMIRLFCLTGGHSNDILARLFARKPDQLSKPSGVLGDMDEKKLAHVTETLRDRGYYVFENRLPPDLVARLVEFASTRKSTIRPTDADAKRGIGPRVAVYDRANPQGLVYDFDPKDLVNNPYVQALITDPSIFAVAQAYIGGSPVLDEVNMWWSVAGNRQPDTAAAQLYHIDMDRIRWLKFFINLTDVTEDNGPHCFIAGSQQTHGIPRQLLAEGYARLSDEQVRKEYPADSFIEFTAPAGTILAEDTRGLHKGKPLIKGDRLMLEFEFSVSLFGATPLKESKFQTYHSKSVEDWVQSHKLVYQRWLT